MMKKCLSFFSLFILLSTGTFMGGVVYADTDASELKCEKTGSAYRIYRSKRLNGEKINAPFSSKQLNILGERGLVLADITASRNNYQYYFSCKEQTVYMVETLVYAYNKVKKRLNELAELGWELASVVTLDDYNLYYLRRRASEI